MAVYKRGGKYWIDFRYPVVEVDPETGEERRATRRVRRPAGANKAQAQRALDRWRGRIAAGEFDPAELEPAPAEPEPEGVLFAKALKTYIEAKDSEGRRMTSYHALRTHWSAAFADRQVASITANEVEEMLSTWRKDREWTAASRNNALRQLGAFLSYCERREWIDRNPVARGRVPLLREDNARERWLRAHELAALRAACPPWLRDIVDVAVSTGLRRGVLLDLRRSNVEEIGGELYVVVERDKNGRRFEKRLTGRAREIVQARVDGTKFGGAYLLPGPSGGNADSSVKREFPKAVRRAGLPYGGRGANDVCFHTLRRTMASQALNAGVSRDEVKKMGNWQTWTMVDRYARLSDERLHAAEDRLAEVIGLGHTLDTTGGDEERRKASGS